ncbi:hypothetical protein VIGAN_11243200, partial [Vigna angularis var. angularis]
LLMKYQFLTIEKLHLYNTRKSKLTLPLLYQTIRQYFFPSFPVSSHFLRTRSLPLSLQPKPKQNKKCLSFIMTT